MMLPVSVPLVNVTATPLFNVSDFVSRYILFFFLLDRLELVCQNVALDGNYTQCENQNEIQLC